MSGKAEDAGAENMQSENMRQDDMRQDDMRAENAGSESGAAAKLTCGVSVAGVNAACIGSNAKPAAENARAESNISAKNAAAESNAGAGEDAESAAGPAARPDSVSGVSGRSPRLRFAGFTQPWQTRKLGELFEEYSEKNHPELPPLSVVQGGGTVLRDESDRNLQYDKSGLDIPEICNLSAAFCMQMTSFCQLQNFISSSFRDFYDFHPFELVQASELFPSPAFFQPDQSTVITTEVPETL